jgi:phosphate/sulfate permease
MGLPVSKPFKGKTVVMMWMWCHSTMIWLWWIFPVMAVLCFMGMVFFMRKCFAGRSSWCRSIPPFWLKAGMDKDEGKGEVSKKDNDGITAGR